MKKSKTYFKRLHRLNTVKLKAALPMNFVFFSHFQYLRLEK